MGVGSGRDTKRCEGMAASMHVSPPSPSSPHSLGVCPGLLNDTRWQHLGNVEPLWHALGKQQLLVELLHHLQPFRVCTVPICAGVVLCCVSCVVLRGVVLCVVCCVVCCVYSCLPPSLPPYPSHLSLSTHASATPRTLLLSLDALRSGLSLLPQFLQPHTHTHRH